MDLKTAIQAALEPPPAYETTAYGYRITVEASDGEKLLFKCDGKTFLSTTKTGYWEPHEIGSSNIPRHIVLRIMADVAEAAA